MLPARPGRPPDRDRTNAHNKRATKRGDAHRPGHNRDRPDNQRADDARRITVSWTDPATLRTRGQATAGLRFLEAIKDGALPPAPIQDLLDFQLVDVAIGQASFSPRPGEQHYNPIGVVHGGLATTLLDSAMGAAVHSTLPAGSGYTTLETKVNLVRAITIETGQIICTGQVVHRGARVCTAEARLTSVNEEKLLAHGTSTCLIMTRSGADR